MKLARFLPIAASLTAVGLVCVMLARAEPPAPVPPAPPDAPPYTLEAVQSPSDVVYRLNDQAPGENACATKACAKGECATKACANGECAAQACAEGTHPAIAGFPLPESPSGLILSCPPWTRFTTSWSCAPAGCETACGSQTACGAACTPTMTVVASEPGEGCACPKKCCCGAECACGEASPHAGFAWGGFAAPELGRYPHPALPAWGPTPPMPHMAPPPFMASIHDAPHPHLHPQLAEAMIENARLAAHNEAWCELQRRQQEATAIAVENAQLRAQIDLATHKEKMFDKMAEVLIQNATLTAQLDAVQERQELIQAVMEVATEKARLEATVEAMEMHVDAHLEMLNTILEAKDELTAPLHEALVENAALKAAAEAQKETAALKSRIADLERTFGKLSPKKDRDDSAPVAKTAKKPGSESIAE